MAVSFDKNSILTVLLTSLSILMYAQEPIRDVGPEPVSGLHKLGLEYFKIDFTTAQRERLNNIQVELIFSVDTLGSAELVDVNGINDNSIVDSLRRKTVEAGHFHPARVEGKRVEGFYSMVLQYPTYYKSRVAANRIPRTYKRLTRDDFESYELGGRMDALIGGIVNGFSGNAHDYLKTGGGFKVDLTFAGKKGYGFGITMVMYGNHRKKDYPIDPTRVQDEAPVTLLFGAAINKTIASTSRSYLLLQLEPAYAMQSISARINNQDKEYVQFNGFSPGVTLNYILKLGRERFTDSYMPALFNHCLNVHAGVRPLFYDSSSGSGVMYEVGLSYRMVYHFFESYTLKD